MVLYALTGLTIRSAERGVDTPLHAYRMGGERGGAPGSPLTDGGGLTTVCWCIPHLGLG